jgi:lipopolysaccharide transport protein LptA/LPS export ABC transporter protein LptC
MAMTFDADRTQGSREGEGGRAAGSGIVLEADRSDSFRRARKHTNFVKFLRWLLPASGAAMCMIYLGALMGSGGFSSAIPEAAIARITPQDLAMQNPNYDGVMEDGGTYRVAAARARQNFDQTDLIELEAITGDLVAKDKSATKLTAASGVFNHKDNVLELTEKIEIRSDNGFSADLTRAIVRTREGRINSDEPVRVGFPAGGVTAKRLEIRQKLREVTFIEDVVARLTPPAKKPADAASAVAKKPETAGALIGSSDGPVDITAARLDIQDLDKRAIFTGNVRATQAGAAIDTPEMTVSYDGGSALPGSQGAAEGAGGKLTRIAVKGPFVMTRDNGDRVTGDGASFDAVAETGLLEGNIVMTSVPNRRVTADRVELDQGRDSAVLLGQVSVVNGETVLTGRRLAIDRAGGRTSLTAPPMAGSGPGRITARFVQKDTGAKKSEPAQPASGVASIAQFKTSPGAPLDVEADSLDVDDNARLAIFRGDVVTKQGDVTMRSAEIRASYTGSARLADTGASGDAPGGSTQLSQIDATGAVVVTTADGRKVTGNSARYEAKSNSVAVSGDVELSQAGTVVRGNRLVIDMTSGKATIDTTASKALAKPSEGWSSEVQGRSTGGRPSAIFFPDELRKAQDKSGQKSGVSKAQPGAAGSGAEGWSSQTLPSGQQ